jgi:4-diphosphocytidyl-2-C-methyl-D-erythritol kinase
MRIKSFAKINLTLRVLKKLKNQMHDIETNTMLVDLFDEINLKRNKKDVVIFNGKFKGNVNLKKNTITDTLLLLRKFKIIKSYYKVTIKKNIPVYSGLGGGTSNSVSIVKYFLKNKIKEKIIRVFEQKIGSDFRLFLNNSSYQKNLGKVFKSKNNFLFYILIVFPNINCKTKNIYKMVKNFSSSSDKIYEKKYKKEKYIENVKKDRNDLQKLVEKKYSNISVLLRSIDKLKGCDFSRMTGSGSVCYGVYKSKKTAKFAFTKLKRKYPKYWCVITKTI